jgi:hypothetical protein
VIPFAVTAVVTSGLAIALLPSARGKLARDPKQVEGISALGFPRDRIHWLGVAELCGVVGLLAGLILWPIGVAAAIGLIGYFLGALAYLRRAPVLPTRPALSATLFLLAAVAALVLRLTS